MVKKPFTDHPQASECYRDAIGYLRSPVPRSDSVKCDKEYCHYRPDDGGVKHHHHHVGPRKPERQGSEKFDIATAHHAKREPDREETERQGCGKQMEADGR